MAKKPEISDESIQLTNSDALSFKAYAVSKGYWNDQFIHYFTRPTSSGMREHKTPEMSRGYFARVSSIRNTVLKYLKLYNNNCYLISIGAGFDTLYFNLYSNNKNLPIKYVEVDFKQICKFKARIIKHNKELFDTIINEKKETDGNEDEIFSDCYNLISADLRNINELSLKLSKIMNMPCSIPTLVVSECVLIYMNTSDSSKLLKFFSDNLLQSSFLNYEQFNLNDKFSQIMIENMQMRSCKLLGIDSCITKQTQINRFSTCGFLNCKLVSMTEYFKRHIDAAERKRVESIEFLDEVELLYQLLDHYCICFAYNYEDTDKKTDLETIL